MKWSDGVNENEFLISDVDSLWPNHQATTNHTLVIFISAGTLPRRSSEFRELRASLISQTCTEQDPSEDEEKVCCTGRNIEVIQNSQKKKFPFFLSKRKVLEGNIVEAGSARELYPWMARLGRIFVWFLLIINLWNWLAKYRIHQKCDQSLLPVVGGEDQQGAGVPGQTLKTGETSGLINGILFCQSWKPIE